MMKKKIILLFRIFFLCWTLLIVSLLLLEIYKINEDSYNLAINKARANFKKDQAFRHWASMHGGVYVKIDEHTKPNPALSHIPERDIVTKSGKKLTLMNPAYMIRELNEHFSEYYGINGHITSKKLLRKENKADSWELNALTEFENGIKEVSGYDTINGEIHLRLMQPMITEKSCLKCHAHQGYKVGDIRGGVGISLPIDPIINRAKSHKARSYITTFLIWLLGSGGFLFAYKNLLKSNAVQKRTENILKQQNEELKVKKKQLKEKNEEYECLNEELRQSNEELLKAKELAEESNRLKTAFIHNLSHEIRTPMNGIIGFSELLNDPNISKDSISKYTEIIQLNSNQLLRSIDDLLEVSSLEKGNVIVNNESACINKIIQDTLFDFKRSQQKSLIPIYITSLLYENNSKIICDKIKISKIIYKLLENALTFTENGFIEIGCTLKDKIIQIFVKDTGIGISKERLPTIFNQFSKASSEKEKLYRGLGLGLSIAQKNAELLKGSIKVESELHKGSIFTLEIPYLPTEIINTIQEAKISSNKKCDILIAEDENTNYLYLKTILKKMKAYNVNIVHAFNGIEAISLFKENHFDFILMDLKMPVMDGFEAMKEIRKINGVIPIIAQTAYSTEQDKQRVLENGCNEYLTKPIDKIKLYNILETYFQQVD